MTKSVILHLNDNPEKMGQRFVDAWNRAEKGEVVGEVHIGFVELPALLSALTSKRMELLRNLHDHEAKDIKALSVRLGRDYKRVYEDVKELKSVGLIEADKNSLRVPFDTIRAEMSL